MSDLGKRTQAADEILAEAIDKSPWARGAADRVEINISDLAVLVEAAVDGGKMNGTTQARTADRALADALQQLREPKAKQTVIAQLVSPTRAVPPQERLDAFASEFDTWEVWANSEREEPDQPAFATFFANCDALMKPGQTWRMIMQWVDVVPGSDSESPAPEEGDSCPHCGATRMTIPPATPELKAQMDRQREKYGPKRPEQTEYRPEELENLDDYVPPLPEFVKEHMRKERRRRQEAQATRKAPKEVMRQMAQRMKEHGPIQPESPEPEDFEPPDPTQPLM